MLTLDLIRKVRQLLSRGESLRAVSERYRLSRNTVRKIARSGATEFKYPKREARYPVLGEVKEKLEERLSLDAELPRGHSRSGRRLYEELRQEGYGGSYDSVRRYVRLWKEKHHISERAAYVPLVFGKGEAFQFDWSEETVELGGVCQKLQVAQVRLCYSRMRFCHAFTRQEVPMLIEAHVRGHDFFGGLCQRGIYDNAKTVVTKIGPGKERMFNKRFVQLSSHYLFEPEACTPAAGWEKGQIENQVKSNRQSVFVPRLRFKDLAELNAHLSERMIEEAHNSRHPEYKDKTVWEVFEEERPYLIKAPLPFDGPVKEERRVNSECLVNYDRNHYSVPCEYANKQVTVSVYADRLSFAYKGETVAEHKRSFNKGHHELNPLHYLPLLERKPGALRNGRPFREWDLPKPIEEVWERIRHYSDWDRQMTRILASIPAYGLEAVSVACEMALEAGTVSQSVILNHLSRLVEDGGSVEELSPPARLVLQIEPTADCKAYDRLLGGRHVA